MLFSLNAFPYRITNRQPSISPLYRNLLVCQYGR